MKEETINCTVFNWGPLLTWMTVTDDFVNGMLIRANELTLDYRDNLAGHLKNEKKFEKKSDLEYFMDNISRYLDVYFDHAWPRHFHKSKPRPTDVQLLSLWVNYMRPGEWNPPHVHSDDLSFVLYLDVPESILQEGDGMINTDTGAPGGIRFIHGSDGLKDTVTTIPHTPRTKDLFISGECSGNAWKITGNHQNMSL